MVARLSTWTACTWPWRHRSLLGAQVEIAGLRQWQEWHSRWEGRELARKICRIEQLDLREEAASVDPLALVAWAVPEAEEREMQRALPSVVAQAETWQRDLPVQPSAQVEPSMRPVPADGQRQCSLPLRLFAEQGAQRARQAMEEALRVA